MFDFGKSLINMNPDEQKKMLENATPGQRKTALEMGIGFKNQNQQQQRQQKRDAYHDLDRLNTIVENENEAHDFFGKSLVNWQKSVTGKKSSKDATSLKKQFDEYEHGILSNYPKGGKRHGALSETLPKIKDGFLKQGHQFALDKLNERSQSVLDKGLQRLAKGALSANDENGIQAHDDQAFDLINKYVLSEAKFDGKDADAMYDKYLSYAGFEPQAAERASDQKGQRESMAAQEKVDAPEKAPAKSSTQHAREVEATAAARNKYPEPKENYPFDDKTYEFIGKNKNAINSAAGKFGVSPEAVAGALGDEYNTRRGLKGMVDSLQDSTVNLRNNLKEIEQEIADGNKSGKTHGANWDIGPGNLNVSTLHEMFVNEVENGDDTSTLKKELKGVVGTNATRQEQWEQYVDYAKTPKGSATLASAYIQKAQEELIPHMDGLGEEEKMAALMTYYKQGPGYLKKYKQATDKKAGADSAESNRPITPGEGTRLLYQLTKIRGALQ
jgi:hypothetical protein